MRRRNRVVSDEHDKVCLVEQFDADATTVRKECPIQAPGDYCCVICHHQRADGQEIDEAITLQNGEWPVHAVGARKLHVHGKDEVVLLFQTGRDLQCSRNGGCSDQDCGSTEAKLRVLNQPPTQNGSR